MSAPLSAQQRAAVRTALRYTTRTTSAETVQDVAEFVDQARDSEPGTPRWRAAVEVLVEQAGPVLRRLLDAESEAEQLRARVAARPEHELGAEWAERLTAMRARTKAATEGPWEPYPGYGPTFYGNIRGEYLRGVGDINFGVGEQAEADLAFVLAAREDVPALLDLVELALVNIRQHQDWHARDSVRMKELEANASAQVPGLRESIRVWSERCRATEADAEALRIRVAELEARANGPVTTWYLADYEGAEDGPALHATVDAAKAWCDEFEAADWVEQDGVWVQVVCDPDTDRPVGRGAGTVRSVELPADVADTRVAELESKSKRLRIAWGMARTRARSAMSGADRYARRAQELQTAAQELLGALLAVQIERDSLIEGAVRLRLALASARRGRKLARARVSELEKALVDASNKAADTATRTLEAARRSTAGGESR